MMPEAGRRAAHVLLDAVTAWDQDADDDANMRAVQLAVDRLASVGAMTVKVDDDVADVDVADLVGPALVLLSGVITALAEARGQEREDVVASYRDFVEHGAL